jgi:hypothetical protein
MMDQTVSYIMGQGTMLLVFALILRWTVWRGLAKKPVWRNALSVTTAWLAWLAFVLPFAKDAKSSWYEVGCNGASYVPFLALAVLLGVWQRRKHRELYSESYRQIFK